MSRLHPSNLRRCPTSAGRKIPISSVTAGLDTSQARTGKTEDQLKHRPKLGAIHRSQSSSKAGTEEARRIYDLRTDNKRVSRDYPVVAHCPHCISWAILLTLCPLAVCPSG